MKQVLSLFVIVSILSIGQFSYGETEWLSLFNGQDLSEWKASENPDSLRVEDGMIVCDGPRAHLFYSGPVNNADFKNFEFKAEVMTKSGANSGIYFHSEYQDEGYPKKGYEAQINNTHLGGGNYRELRKTGSLYGIRNLYKSIVEDDEWFTYQIKVVDKQIQIWLNDMLVVDYTEPENLLLQEKRGGKYLSHGTFAIQCHDPDSLVYIKNIQVKPLPDDLQANSIPAATDDIAQKILDLNLSNFPIIDLHVHLKGGLTLDQAKAMSRYHGINYGIAVNCGLGFPVTSDEAIYEFLDSMEGQPVYVAMQAEGREWLELFSEEARSEFDYVFTDALTWTDDQGNRTRLWIPEEVFIENKQAFMDTYVDRIQGVMQEPIDIFVNPTFLPEEIADEYDQLWTKERMTKVIQAAVDNDVAIEINSRYKIPSENFLKLAKDMGAKFSFGTNNGESDLGRLEYCLEMMIKCGIEANDMYLPNRLD